MKHSRILLFYVLAAVLAVYARTAQLLYLTEPKTGFFSADNAIVAYFLFAFIIAATIATVVLAFLSKRMPNSAPKPHPALAAFSGFLALCFLYEGVFATYITNIFVLVVIVRMFAVLSAAAMGLFALSPFFGEKVKLPKIILTLPSVYLIFKVILMFTVYATVSTIADNIFYLAFLSLALIFFTLFAKIENSVSLHRSAYFMFPAAVACSVFAFCCFVPQIIVLLCGRAEVLHCDFRSMPLCAAVAAFNICYILLLYKKDNLKRHKRQTHSLKGFGTADDYDNQFVTDSGSSVNNEE